MQWLLPQMPEGSRETWRDNLALFKVSYISSAIVGFSSLFGQFFSCLQAFGLFLSLMEMVPQTQFQHQLDPKSTLTMLLAEQLGCIQSK
jgi:hypothetical protein